MRAPGRDGAVLVVLGAGSALPRAGYGPAGYALLPGRDLPVTLLDCGPGTVRTLGAVGIGLERVQRVVLSHFHTDHCLDLFALCFARRNPRFDSAPRLEVIGPLGTAALLEEGAAALKGHPRDPRCEVVEVDPGAGGRGRHAAGELELECAPTRHTETALAWRVGCPGGETLAYTGDTGEEPEVARLALGVDLFVAECSFPEEAPMAKHLTPSSAGRLAAAAGCRRLLLTHFYPETDPEQARRVAAREFSGPIELARDGSRHAV